MVILIYLFPRIVAVAPIIKGIPIRSSCNQLICAVAFMKIAVALPCCSSALSAELELLQFRHWVI